MIKFTDIAKGDEAGLDKVNKNFDAVEQSLNLEERKEVLVPLLTGWEKQALTDNPLKIIVTPGCAWLRGDIAWASATPAGFGSNKPIAKIPSEITFRGVTYSVDLDAYFLAPIGDSANIERPIIRLYLNDAGYLYIDEPKDLITSHPFTINTLLDIKKKG